MDYNRHMSPLYIKSKKFATRISNMVSYLQANRNKTMSPLFSQVLRSGTSVFANINESQFAQSQADFITKLHIALKEANETDGWLELLCQNGCLTDPESQSMRNDCSELIAMLTASLKTSKKNQQQIVK